MLTNHVGMADRDSAFDLRLEVKILRWSSDDRAMPDEISGAHLNRSLDHDV